MSPANCSISFGSTGITTPMAIIIQQHHREDEREGGLRACVATALLTTSCLRAFSVMVSRLAPGESCGSTLSSITTGFFALRVKASASAKGSVKLGVGGDREKLAAKAFAVLGEVGVHQLGAVHRDGCSRS